MKKFLLLTVLFLAQSSSWAASSLTGHGQVRLTNLSAPSAVLYYCGGSAELTSYGGTYNVVLRGIQNCSNLELNGRNLGKYNESYQVVPVYPGSVVRLASNSGHTSETIYVTVHHVPAPVPVPQPSVEREIRLGWLGSYFSIPKTISLYDCGGELTAETIASGQLRLTFRNVSNCSKFDILGANGQSVNYPVQPLSRERDGEFAGSFTIPQRYIGYGTNSIKIILRSNSGKTDEVVRIIFVN